MTNGKPNYIMAEEYPYAHQCGKRILPAEMKSTNRQSLKKLYDGIPECVDAHNDRELRERLLNSLIHVAISNNSEDPEHNYLIGLAYLEGIDVEVNIDRGVELIVSSGKCGYPEAMVKLSNMYQIGDHVQHDYWRSLVWADKLYDSLMNKTRDDFMVLDASINLAKSYNRVKALREALRLFKKAYKMQCKLLSEMHPDTMNTLIYMAKIYCKIGDFSSALRLYTKIYVIYEETPDGGEAEITILEKLAKVYASMGNFQKEKELIEKAYALRSTVFEEDINTIKCLDELARIHIMVGDIFGAISIIQKS